MKKATQKKRSTLVNGNVETQSYIAWIADLKRRYRATQIKAAVAVKKDDTKPGFFARVGKWFREMKSELKKVIWPTPAVLAKNTGISVAVMVVSAIVLWGFDELAQMLVRALFTLVG